jgi:hypothetical protein
MGNTMSARTETEAVLNAADWTMLDTGPTRDSFFRWGTGNRRQFREELHLIYNNDGQTLASWSRWENRRTHIDGDTGLRKRLTESQTP